MEAPRFHVVPDFMPEGWSDAARQWGRDHASSAIHPSGDSVQSKDHFIYQHHYDIKPFEGWVSDEIEVELREAFDEGREACEVPPFGVRGLEISLAVRGEGHVFHYHTDHRGDGEPETRMLSFCYYMHERPRAFMGGELEFAAGAQIAPQDNRLVWFAPYQLHRVRHVHFLPGSNGKWLGRQDPFRFARWAIVGWFHCEPGEEVEKALKMDEDVVHPRALVLHRQAEEYLDDG